MNLAPAMSPIMMNEEYTSRSAHKISEMTFANYLYRIARYESTAFSPVLNPAIQGVQKLNQYVKWIGNDVGQLYCKLYFHAEGPFSNLPVSIIPAMYSKSYASPVPTSYVTQLGGTPIPCQNGEYYISLNSTTWTGINILLNAGETSATVEPQLQNLLNGIWKVIQYSPPNGGINFTANATNQTLTFSNLGWIDNYASGIATAIRIALICTNGTIQQTTAGGNGLGAYDMKSGNQLNTTQAIFRTLLCDGTNDKLTLTQNTTIPYPITHDLPVTTSYSTDGFVFPALQVDVYFSQPLGNTNHVELWFNDGYLSHLQSSINGTASSPMPAQF